MYQQQFAKPTKQIKSKAFKDRLKGHKDAIITLISPYGINGNYLYSASRDGNVKSWDLLNRQIASKFLISKISDDTTVQDQDENQQTTKGNIICAATFSESNIYVGYDDGFIKSNNIKTGESVYSYQGHKAQVTSIHFLNIRQLASSSLDGTVRLWDTTSNECEVIFNIGYPINSMNVIFDKEINLLYGKNTIVQVDPYKQSILRSVQFPNFTIMSYLVHKNLLILGTIDNFIHLYELQSLDQPNPQPIKVIVGLHGWALCMLVHDPYLYIGTDDKKIKVYEMKNWELKEDFSGHIDGVTTLALANGLLYSGSYDHLIRSWDLEEMYQRIRERAIMEKEDLNSRRYDVYLKSLPKKKKAPPKKKK
ncbi:unnamed protein product [Paramecium sonneborni]|uniref:Uncharacterized protein n=1 Tax=Paramecium sonneborni TaxID=65129 RepID=A0A8S1L1N4_9CILI|nr:unnamed protein product [Paramecium sonneborni]